MRCHGYHLPDEFRNDPEDTGVDPWLTDVVFADCLCGTDVLRFAKADALIVPVGKRAGKPSAKQEMIMPSISSIKSTMPFFSAQ